MSLGVAVLNEALKALSTISHFDFQIEEIHHNKKKNKPSGTAITLQENFAKSRGEKLPGTPCDSRRRCFWHTQGVLDE